jgi:fucose permease
MAGIVIQRLSARRTVAVMAMLLALALAVAGIGSRVGVVLLVIGLFLLGLANGSWDVAMNVHGAAAERHLGRAIMPRFHAGYSLGTVAGALLGAAMVALHVAVALHLGLVAVLIAGTVPAMTRRFLPDAPHDVPAAEPAEPDGATGAADAGDAADGARPRQPHALVRWREPRTLLIGLFVLAFAFAEGAGNDWISVALIDGYHTAAVTGTVCFALFLTAMTAGRWVGPSLLDRYGRVVVMRGLTAVALLGLIAFVFGPVTPLAFAGAVLWGVGVSLGFPIGMSAAADEPRAAAARVSVVASIGYCAFLGGPPLIGFLGSHLTTLRALIAVPVLLALALAITGAVRPLSGGPGQE